MPKSRFQVKQQHRRRHKARHKVLDRTSVLRDQRHPGLAAVRSTAQDGEGNRAVLPWRIVPESVAEEMPTDRAHTEWYVPIRTDVFLRFSGWRTLTKKTNGKKRVRAILRRVCAVMGLEELNRPDNPDRIEPGVFRLVPRREEQIQKLWQIVRDNPDCLWLSERPYDA